MVRHALDRVVLSTLTVASVSVTIHCGSPTLPESEVLPFSRSIAADACLSRDILFLRLGRVDNPPLILDELTAYDIDAAAPASRPSSGVDIAGEHVSSQDLVALAITSKHGVLQLLHPRLHQIHFGDESAKCYDDPVIFPRG